MEMEVHGNGGAWKWRIMEMEVHDFHGNGGAWKWKGHLKLNSLGTSFTADRYILFSVQQKVRGCLQVTKILQQ